MTHRLDVAPSRDLAGRWCALAEQRLEYLTEMFESGRWRRFYSEVAFLENIQEAKFAVETWRGLSTPNLARGVAAVELALSVTAIPAPVHAAEPDPALIVPEPLELTAEDELAVEDAQLAAADEMQSEPVIDMVALQQALDSPDGGLDMAAIEHRYPLLRNTL
jgi:uncharacterized repeat protein (TIGR03809 family)